MSKQIDIDKLIENLEKIRYVPTGYDSLSDKTLYADKLGWLIKAIEASIKPTLKDRVVQLFNNIFKKKK